MPRYLTPSKIGLLVLIAVYVEGHVSLAASIPVLSFLMQHLLPPKSSQSGSGTTTNIQDFQEALAKLPSDFPGRTVWDLFLRQLWTLDSLHSLHAFFEALPALLAKSREELVQERDSGRVKNDDGIRLSRTSPLGIFVRRAQVEFTRMQMEDGITLWKSLLQFRESTRAMARKRNPSLNKSGFDSNTPIDGAVHDILYGDLNSGRFQASNTSVHDVEMLLEFQLEKIQKGGERLSPIMIEQFSEMVKLAVDLPVRISYLKFLDAWRGGDYPSAYDNLHRYFDYTMQSKDRTFYQYALLNLAILHADFGSWLEAISAINETITTAREYKDIPCLNYALSWLFHFGKSNPKELEHVRKTGVLGTDREGLAFLKAKARESGMWGLLATCYLTEARQIQLNGESIYSAFECIAKAAHLNLVKDIPVNKGSELNVQSALFSRLGQKHLAWLSDEVFMTCYAGTSQSEDVLHFTCRSALMQASRGHYHRAFLLLETLTPSITRVVKHQQFWIACNLLIKLRQAINNMNFIAANHFLTQLQANIPPNHDISFAIHVHAIELEIRRGQLDVAMELVEKRLSDIKNGESDMYHGIKFMVLKAQIFAKAGLPQKGFSLSLRAAALAHRARHLNVLWEAIGAFSKVLCSLSEFEAAVQLLKAIIPQVSETEDGELVADSYSYLADAYMGLAGEAKDGSSRRKEQMNKVLECLDKAFDEYSRHDHVQGQCEMLSKKATIMHLNGDLVLANDIASKYLDIKKAAMDESVEILQSVKA